MTDTLHNDKAIDDHVQHGIDDEPSHDAEKGAALGGVGGAVVGGIAGAMAGPVGAVVGAVAGAAVGSLGSGVAVAVVDSIDNDNTVTGLGDGSTLDVAPQTSDVLHRDGDIGQDVISTGDAASDVPLDTTPGHSSGHTAI